MYEYKGLYTELILITALINALINIYVLRCVSKKQQQKYISTKRQSLKLFYYWDIVDDLELGV
jgi:hypothetical protein